MFGCGCWGDFTDGVAIWLVFGLVLASGWVTASFSDSGQASTVDDVASSFFWIIDWFVAGQFGPSRFGELPRNHRPAGDFDGQDI